ncbi:DUF3604 domain-containing protein [Streptomyces sp. BE303]|uniref:DUF3604 domain-containing protein n=1 Tax=Streptomyces sp. BE303 TaxID=3002528 RepID=UPI002E76E5A0|nr:DUF3604 domain-containing protein [Streptomyces sp. BE303]MED7951355.1 DUF3604 domain-containing protein [Streptomyces sp. BE303]
MTAPTTDAPGYGGLGLYVGDIHNHCGISYGHGPIEDAYANARLQLDFASVTGHGWWHDLPERTPELASLVDYHTQGFARLADRWEHVQEVTAAAHEDGRFVTFQSFEWHSLAHGDHCVYFDGPRGEIIRAAGLEELRARLRALAAEGVRTWALPHHIGYGTGRRGINWDTYTEEFAPVVEMMSMHGCAESDEAPRTYLHTMGPRDTTGTAVHGLRLGHRFGLIGSTDHHSAFPGSHGHGRLAVWAPELTRPAIWDAIERRSTYAITGDRILLAASVNGAPMGAETASADRRRIRVTVQGRDALDHVEVVRNGVPIHRVSRPELLGAAARSAAFDGTLGFAVGWGKRETPVHWDVTLRVEGGELLDVQPRLRGSETVAPAAAEPASYRPSDWWRTGPGELRLRTVTEGNPNTATDATQGFSLAVAGDDRTRLTAVVNGVETSYAVGELREGSRTGFIGGFVSGAFRFDRAVPAGELTAELDLIDERPGGDGDFYHVRVRQLNDQWAWSSPTWVGRATGAGRTGRAGSAAASCRRAG